MTKRETETTERLLSDRVDRTETAGSDASGGWCLTAHWRTGGQKLFHTLDQVRAFLADRQQAAIS